MRLYQASSQLLEKGSAMTFGCSKDKIAFVV